MLFDYKKPVVIMRPGKTARDKASGALGRRATNANLRAEWHRDAKASGANRGRGTPFPLEICNGRESQAIRRAGKRQPRKEKP